MTIIWLSPPSSGIAALPLNRPDLLYMKGDPDSAGVWAPCLSHADGKFWLIYSDVTVVDGDAFKDVANYLTTCETIDGEWSAPVYLNGVGFDSSLFHDDDGKKYLLNMIWDHRPGKHQFNGIALQEYDHAAGKLVGERRRIFTGTDLGLTEAPHLYKWDGMYYLLTAEGGTGYEHAATLARSKRIDGGYEVHPQNPLITSWHDPRNPLQKAGHASIIQAANKRWYLAHLTGRPIREDGIRLLEYRGDCPLGRETAIQELEWGADGWPRVVGGGNTPKMTVSNDGLPETVWEKDWPGTDDFDRPVLNHHFQTLRVPFTDDIGSLSARAGHLRLYGKGSPQSTFVQAQVARRWESLFFDAETVVEFSPAHFQHMAGLVCYYNTKNWVYLHLTHDEEKGRVLDLMQCERGASSAPLGGCIAVPDGAARVGLRVAVRGKRYGFLYSFDGKVWIPLPCVFESRKLSDDYIQQRGFFTGAFVGMLCCDLSGGNHHADFDSFSYREISGIPE